MTPDDIGRLNPAIRLDGIAGGAFCPSDGFLRPLKLLEGYLGAARRLGVRVEWGVDVSGVSRRPTGRSPRARDSRGPVEVEAVVNAAGPWAAAVAALAGVALPVTPLRRQIVPTAPTDLLPPTCP